MSFVRNLIVTVVALFLVAIAASTQGWFGAQAAPVAASEALAEAQAAARNPRYFYAASASDALPPASRNLLAPRRSTLLYPVVRTRARYATPEAVMEQLPAIARTRGIAESTVRHLVELHVEYAPLGPLSTPGVNIPLLNLALDALP